MKKINIIFDYIYYRLNKLYYRWDGENGTTSIIGVSMFQSMIIGNTILIILKIILTKEELRNFPRFFLIVIVIFIIFQIYNYFRYKNKYSVLKERWENETKKEYIQRGILVLLALVLPWVFIIALAFV